MKIQILAITTTTLLVFSTASDAAITFVITSRTDSTAGTISSTGGTIYDLRPNGTNLGLNVWVNAGAPNRFDLDWSTATTPLSFVSRTDSTGSNLHQGFPNSQLRVGSGGTAVQFYITSSTSPNSDNGSRYDLVAEPFSIPFAFDNLSQSTTMLSFENATFTDGSLDTGVITYNGISSSSQVGNVITTSIEFSSNGVAAIPEPSTTILLLAGALSLAVRRRR